MVSGRRLLELLERAVTAGTVPGAVAQWGGVSAGRSFCAAAGWSRLDNFPPQPATSDTWYDLASLTKPLVTTTLTLVAKRRGLLAFETRVGEVLEELDPGAFPGSSTVDELLTHTSGLPGWLPLYALTDKPEHCLRDVFASTKPEYAPRQEVVYSCPGFILLGFMLERVFDRGLANAFQAFVAEPLSLGNSLGFRLDPQLRNVAGGAQAPLVEERLVAERGLSPDRIPESRHGDSDDGNCRFLGGAAGNSGLFGTVSGVARLALEYLPKDGVLLSREDAESATFNSTPNLNQHRGRGWQISSSPGCSAGPGLSTGSFGHIGFTGTSVWVDPESENVAVLLSNRNHPNNRELDLHPLRRRFNALATSR